MVHRALIERLRGESTRRFGTAQFWFLTEDKVLSRFGHLALEGEALPTIPFCISGAAWGQIARCFTPRTDDFDQTITDLLASPYLRFGKRRNLGEVQQAVARISTMLGDGGSPKVVAAAVNDETLEAVSGVSEPEQKDRVLLEAYRESEDALGKRMEQLQVRIESVEEKLDEERGKQEASESEAAAASEEKEQLAKTIEKQQEELEEAEEALARERSTSASEIERIRSDQAEKEKTRKEDVDRRIRIGLMVAAIICLVAAIALPMAGVISVSAALIGGGLAVPLLVARLIEKSRWSWTILFVLAVIAVVLGVLPLVTKN